MSKKIKIAFIWQYSQPYLKDSNGHYLLPVIRQHLQRDYIDMLKIANHYENIKLNFNIVPALLDQLKDYASGEASDYTWFLTKKKVEELESHEKVFIYLYLIYIEKLLLTKWYLFMYVIYI